jgi:hypothetical protein
MPLHRCRPGRHVTVWFPIQHPTRTAHSSHPPGRHVPTTGMPIPFADHHPLHTIPNTRRASMPTPSSGLPARASISDARVTHVPGRFTRLFGVFQLVCGTKGNEWVRCPTGFLHRRGWGVSGLAHWGYCQPRAWGWGYRHLWGVIGRFLVRSFVLCCMKTLFKARRVGAILSYVGFLRSPV